MTPRRPAAKPSVGQTTREQIIAVTLEAIRSEGLATLTIRQIADRAGVNVAVVNYHFGSKDALVNHVLVELTAGLRQAFAPLAVEDTPPQQRLGQFLEDFAAVLTRYPDVYRQAIATGLLGGEAQQQYLGFLRSEGLQTVARLVREVTGEREDRRLRLRIVAAIGGLVYPILVGSLIEPAVGLQLAEERSRRELAAICLQNLLGPAPAAPPARRRPRSTAKGRGA